MLVRSFSVTCLFLLLGFWTQQAFAQVAVTECIRQYVAKRNETQPLGIAPNDVELTIADIAASIGLTRGIDVVPCELDVTAFAKGINDGEIDDVPAGEYLVYNNDWFESVGGKSINTAGIVVLSHELAHFLNSHFTTRRSTISRIEKEKEADAFTGCAVARMKKDYAELKDTLERLRTQVATSDYPDEATSVRLATKMFKSCGGEPVPSPNPKQPLALPVDFLPYEGPRYNSTKKELEEDWPSGNWKFNESGNSQFLYTTSIENQNNRKVTLNFFEKDGKQTRTTFFSRARVYTANSSKHGVTREGDGDEEYKALCSERFNAYKEILASYLGGIKDKPVVTENLVDEDYTESSKDCEEELDFYCKTKGIENTTKVFFKKSKGITLNMHVRDVDETGKGDKLNDRRWVKSQGKVCEVSINIDRN